MTPDEWDNANDPQQMLTFLRDSCRLTERKARLFAVACCRRFWGKLTDVSRWAVELAERYADGRASHKAIRDAYTHSATLCLSTTAMGAVVPEADRAARETSVFTAREAARDAEVASFRAVRDEEYVAQADLLRDFFRPFHPVTLNPSCLVPPVVALATTFYDKRSFERLPELARALVDDGYMEAGLLGHLNSPGPHVRGCWTLDAVLNRK
jgi:hypothetical protein